MASRLERVIQVLLVLQSGVPYNALQMAQRMGVHRRTIFRDIALLRSIGLPISYDVDTSRYSLPRSVPNQAEEVTADELSELLVAACLSILPDGKSQVVARRAVAKLSRRIPRESRRELLRVMRSFVPRVPAGSSPVEREILDLLLQSIRKGLALEIEVNERDSTAFRTVQVAPVQLSFLGTGWTLSAYVVPGGPALELGLSSIRHAMLTESEFSPWSRQHASHRSALPLLGPSVHLE